MVFVICYIDDCLIYTKENGMELRKKHLHIAFKKLLQEAGLGVSKVNCKFNRKENTFLGNDTATSQGIKPFQKKVNDIALWSVLRTVQDIQKIMNICQ